MAEYRFYENWSDGILECWSDAGSAAIPFIRFDLNDLNDLNGEKS
jgi:hypothetical protein